MPRSLAGARLRLVRTGSQPVSERPARVLSDDEVLDAIARGDDALSSEICERLLGVVDATLVRVLGRREPDHDDLAQSALEQIVTSVYRGRFARRCTLATWAAAIASNVALHTIRKRRIERRIFNAFEDVEQIASSARRGADPEAALLARQDLQRVRAHLSRMSERLSRTLVLHDVLGCELEEAAQLLGISIAAAQSRLSRGRRELYRRLQKDGSHRRHLQ